MKNILHIYVQRTKHVGGVQTLEQAAAHLSMEASEREGWGAPVHGTKE